MLSREIQRVSISTSTILRFFAVILGLALLFVIRDVLFALIFAVIIASAVEPSIEWFKKQGLNRILAVVVIYIAFVVFAAFLMYLVLPLMADELHVAAGTFTKIQRQIVLGIQQTAGTEAGSFIAQNADVLLKIPLQYLGMFSQSVSAGSGQVFRGLFTSFLIFVFSFYLSTQEKGIETFLRIVTPLKYEPCLLYTSPSPRD